MGSRRGRERTARQIRNGIGHRAYRRERERLLNQCKRNNTPCAWCGKPINYKLPATHPMSFTADHPEAIANGGKLVGQRLKPFHRRCNSAKSNSVEAKIRDAS